MKPAVTYPNAAIENGSLQNTLGPDPLFFQELVELNEAGLFTLENDIVTYANPAFCIVMEESIGNIVGHSICKKIIDEDQKKVLQVIQKLISKEIDFFTDNLRIASKNGNLKYFSFHLRVKNISHQGKAIIIGASRDSTRRVLHKEELKISEKRYRKIFENSHEAITFLDFNSGKMIDCNRNALKLYGAKSKKELMNLPKENFHRNFLKSPHSADRFIAGKMKEALNNGKSYATFEAKKLTGKNLFTMALLWPTIPIRKTQNC